MFLHLHILRSAHRNCMFRSLRRQLIYLDNSNNIADQFYCYTNLNSNLCMNRVRLFFSVPFGHAVHEMLAASVAPEVSGCQPALQVQRSGDVPGALPAAESQVAMQETVPEVAGSGL